MHLKRYMYPFGETTQTLMSIDAELERTIASLAALCRRSFGPCGEETLLFRPAEAPVVTGEGHAVLAAWKQGLSAADPLATFLLTAANGVHKQLGDGSSEFILLVDAAVRHAAEALGREQGAGDRVRLSRAFAELKWKMQQEMQTPQSDLSRLKLAVPVEIDRETMQPSKQFRVASAKVLISGLRGVLGEHAVEFVAELILKWIFTLPAYPSLDAAEKADKLLFRRVQQFLKGAPDAVIFMASPSVRTSYVVPRDEFILKKSVVASQPPGMLDGCPGRLRFACFTCSLSLSDGSNHVELATSTDEELFTAHDAAHMFISRFVRHLRDRQEVHLVICTEDLDESVIAACTRQGIACIQLAEPEDVEALCMNAGIFPLASVFDDITSKHVGICMKGVSKVRFHQQACLRLRGLTEQSEVNRKNGPSVVVPQLIVRAPTKGVYKQYYAAIVKGLRIIRSWLEAAANTDVDQSAIAYCCRGGGATELAIARWLQCGDKKSSPSQAVPHDAVMLSLAEQILANSLIEVVSILRNNLSKTCYNASDEGPEYAGDQRLVLLDAFCNLNVKDQLSSSQGYNGYTLDYSRVLQTLAGPIQIPEVVKGDPVDFGLLHPWRRSDTLLFLVLQTLEQLFRIDSILLEDNSKRHTCK